MASETYTDLYYSEEEIRLTILTNICRMMIRRGYMDKSKYGYPKDKIIKEDKEKKSAVKSVVKSPSSIDDIDNSLFLPFIETRVDNNTYIIPLDTPYRDQREAKGEAHADFDGSSIVVKLIPQVVKDITNSPILNDFFKQYNTQHKIVVFDGMADKVYSVLSKKKNVEVFDRDYLMIDLMSHIGAPILCSIISDDDISFITNPKIAKILENDPLCRYYNGKKSQIMRIVRSSLNNSQEIAYRRIIDGKSVFK